MQNKAFVSSVWAASQADPMCPFCPSPSNLKYSKLVASMITCHMAVSCGSTTRSWSVWQPLWRPGGRRPMTGFLHHSILHRKIVHPRRCKTIPSPNNSPNSKYQIAQRSVWLEVSGRSKPKALLSIWDCHSKCSGPTYNIELTVPWEVLWKRLSNTRDLSMLSWQLMLSNVDGKPRFVQWKTAAEAFWAIIRLLKDLGIWGQVRRQTIKALSGAAEEATQWRTWDVRCCWWALWRCCGTIIETTVNEGAHLRTSMKLNEVHPPTPFPTTTQPVPQAPSWLSHHSGLSYMRPE